jgi:putative heme-binding domain-containing protein
MLSRLRTPNRALSCAATVFLAAAAWAGTVYAQNPTMLGHPEDYPRADIEHGARLYAENCDRCHGPDGRGVNGVDLRSGKFNHATTDGQLRNVITTGFPTAGMPAFTFDPTDLTGVVAYLRNMNSIDRGSLKPGNAAHGQTVVETKGACLSCHRINDKGSRKAPDLSSIGSGRSAGSLERSLLDPTSQMWPINRPVHIVTKDGKTINGRRLNEDTYTVQVTDEEGRLISLNKSDLREFTISTKSTMPSYKQELSPDELSDVVTYLLSLKGQ